MITVLDITWVKWGSGVKKNIEPFNFHSIVR